MVSNLCYRMLIIACLPAHTLTKGNHPPQIPAALAARFCTCDSSDPAIANLSGDDHPTPQSSSTEGTKGEIGQSDSLFQGDESGKRERLPFGSEIMKLKSE